MRKLASTVALYVLTAAMIIAVDAPGAKPSRAGQTGGNRRTPAILSRTNPNNAVVREVVGHGRYRGDAVKDALYRAVEQVRGAIVDSTIYNFVVRAPNEGIGTDDEMIMNGVAYSTEIGGFIKSYKVLDEKQIDLDTYEVRLEVSVYDSRERGQTKRVKIALMPAKTQQATYGFLGQNISGNTLSSVFYQRLLAGLTQTNKFAVLDRDSLDDFAKEKAILFSLDAPLSERARLSETLGADYLLVGTISQALIERTERRLKAANFTVSRFKARFNFDYRLVDSATKQVVVVSTAQKYLEDEDVRRLADEQNPDEWDSTQVRDAFITLVANDVIAAIIDRVYPISVHAIIDGDTRVVLNQGGQMMKNGMLFDVFTTGQEIVDNDTGESLGRIESQVGTIEVEKVTHTMSIAKIVAGDASKINVGSICRLKKREGAKPDAVKRKRKKVTLPFD